MFDSSSIREISSVRQDSTDQMFSNSVYNWKTLH